MSHILPVASLADQKFSVSIPDGWESARDEEWCCYLPAHGIEERQGWKIHISATIEQAHETLEQVAQIAIEHGLPFNHLSTAERFFWRNSKLCAREHAGKFIALYPPLDKLDYVLEDLEKSLKSSEGPYILSDRRWSKAPVYLRFGVFQPHVLDGRVTTSFVDPAGNEVPDLRSVRFNVPKWAPATAKISKWLQQSDSREQELPFVVSKAIQFSNAGGVYQGNYKGSSVLIKEGRKHAGLDPMLQDAATRLAVEHRALSALDSVRGIPSPYAQYCVWEHVFLLQEKAPGVSLHQWVQSQKIFDRMWANQNFERYIESSFNILRSLYSTIKAMHERGWSHMDVHPANVLVDKETWTVTLIDFENAVEGKNESKVQQLMAAPGFGLEGEHNPQVFDFHGLRQIGIFLLFPSVAESLLNPNHADTIIQRLRMRESYLGLSSRSGILGTYIDFLEELGQETRHLCLSSDVTGSQEIYTYETVISLLEQNDFPVHDRAPCPTEGIFSAQNDEIRDEGQALKRIEAVSAAIQTRSFKQRWRVYDGMAGTLLALLQTHCHSRTIRQRVDQTIEDFAALYLETPEQFAPLGMTRSTLSNSVEHQDSGLFYGHLGYAWLFSRCLNEPLVAQACTKALENELTSYRLDSEGLTLQLSQGKRLLPYLSTGSAGFGIVLPHIPREIWPEGLDKALPLLYRACDSTGSAFAGLMNGYAGLQLGRAGLAHLLDYDKPYQRSIDNIIDSLIFYGIHTSQSRLALAGEASTSPSLSIAEGAGGLLIALKTLQQQGTDFFWILNTFSNR